MTVKLLYFAWVREKAGLSSETVELPGSVATVADLMAWLAARGGGFAEAFAGGLAVRAAINQAHVQPAASLKGAREIAFFPPVTGG